MKNLQNRSQRKLSLKVRIEILVYSLILAIGIIMCIVDIGYLGNIGGSLIASAIVSGTLLFFLHDWDTSCDFNAQWGLEEIHENRRICISERSFPKSNLDIIAFGLSHFIRENQNVDFIVNRVKTGLRIRIVTLHPNSFYVDRQKEFEGKNGDLSKEINELNEWVSKIKRKLGVRYKDRISIKFYNSIPLYFYCRADSTVYLGNYEPGVESNDLLTYEYNRKGKAAQRYIESFDRIWENADNRMRYIRIETPRVKSNMKSSIETTLQFFSSKYSVDESVSVVGVVVIFKEELRRTFYSCNKEPYHESNRIYGKEKGAFGDALDLNKQDWVGDNQQTLVFKDYKNRKYATMSITVREGTEVHIAQFQDDKVKMDGKIDAVVIAPLIRDNQMFGAVTFDFVGLPKEYNDASENDEKLKDFMRVWFDYALVCAKLINHSLGTPKSLEFDALFDEDWREY